MRKQLFKRFTALALAVLMLLSAVPAEAATLITSENEVRMTTPVTEEADVQAAPGARSDKTAFDIVQDAIDSNPTNPRVQVAISRVGDEAVLTGAAVSYQLLYNLGQAPQYKDTLNDQALPAYTEYKTITVTITPPGDFVLVDDTGKTVGTSDSPYVISLERQAPGTTGIRTIRGRSLLNGLAENGQDLGRLAVSVTAEVEVTDNNLDQTKTMTFPAEKIPVDTEGTAVKAKALDTQYGVRKSASKTIAQETKDGVTYVTFTYPIQFGMLVNGTIVTDPNEYKVAGLSAFKPGGTFTLEDILPKIAETGTHKEGLRPASAVLKLNGEVVAGYQIGEVHQESISTGRYSTISVDGHPLFGKVTDIPGPTAYQAVVMYPLDELTHRYGDFSFTSPETNTPADLEKLFQMENTARVTYERVGLDEKVTAESAASITYRVEEEPAKIRIWQKINVNGADQDYTLNYRGIFPNARYALYKAEDFDLDAGRPIEGRTPVLDTGFDNNASSYLETPDLAAGKYVAVQVQKPDNTLDLEPSWRAIDVKPGTTHREYFVNKTPPAQGMLVLKKQDQDKKVLAGAGFALFAGGEQKTAEVFTDAGGQLVIAADAGEYELRELTVPEGKVRVQPIKVKLESGRINDILLTNPIVNYANAATLTIRKFVVQHVNPDTHVPVGKPAAPNVQSYTGWEDVSFTLSRSEDGGDTWTAVTFNAGEAGETSEIKLTKNGDVTLSNLPRANDSGAYYTYKLVENAVPADAAFARDPYVYQWQYGPDTADKKAEFYNTFTSRMKVKKVVVTFDEATGKPVEAPREGAKFALLKAVGTGKEAVTDTDGQPITLVTGEDGTAQSPALPVRDGKGNTVQYYLQEDAAQLEGYILTDKNGASQGDLFGPLSLNDTYITDFSSQQPMQNREDTGVLSVYKTSMTNGNLRLPGAEFKVYTLENGAKKYLTDAQGADRLFTTVGGNLYIKVPRGKTYYIEETKAPDGYMLATAPVSATVPGTALGTATAAIRNHPLPTLSASKSGVSLVTGSNGAAANLGGIVFKLYTRDDSGSMTPALDRQGHPLQFSATQDNGLAPQSVTIWDYTKRYYVKETGVDSRFIPAGQTGGMVDGAINTAVPGASNNLMEVNGEYYAGPFDLSKGGNYSFTWKNTINLGQVQLTKVDSKDSTIKLKGYTVDIAVQTGDAAIQAILTKEGFSEKDGRWVKTVTASTPTVTVSGLPLVDSAGNKLQYTYLETKAPDGYHLNPAYTKPGDPAAADPDKADPVTFDLTTPKGGLFTGTLQNPRKAEFQFTKYGYDEYDARNAAGARALYQLDGSSFALYKIDSDGTLHYIEEKSATNYTFSDLYATDKYAVVETKVPDSHRITALAEGGSERVVLSPANELDGKNASVLDMYNHLTHDFGEDDADDYIYSAAIKQEAQIANGAPYWQLDIRKFLLKDDGSKVPLNLARFDLYGMDKAEYEASTKDLEALSTDARRVEKDLESGTIAEGKLASKKLYANKVYWLKETAWPVGTEPVSVFSGPYMYEDAYRNAAKPVEVVNKPVTVQGGGTPQAFQLKLRKVLFEVDDKTGAESYHDLAGVTFDIYLTDAAFDERLEKLAELTTGINRDIPELLGTGISGHTIIDDALMEQYPQAVTKNSDNTYTFNILLVERSYPLLTTPRNGGEYGYTYTTKPLDLGLSHVDTHFWGATEADEKNIRNDGGLSYPIRVYKKGYHVDKGTGEAVPLEGAEIGLFERGKTTPYRRATTGVGGFVRFNVPLYKDYEIREISAPEGYELSAEKFELKALTQLPETPVGPFTIYNKALRRLVIHKVDGDGKSLENVTFNITNNDGSGLKDGNNKDRPEGYGTVVTGEDGNTPGLLLRGDGSYRIAETLVDGKAPTDLEQTYFALANKGKLDNVRFAGTEDTKTVTLVNPGKGQLTITKQDNHGVKMPNVAFTLLWKAFNRDNFDQPAGNWGNPPGLTAPLTGTTGEDGVLTLDNLTPGWYQVTETVPQGYLAQPGAFVLPVYGKGLGPTDAQKTGLNSLTVTNIPLVPLTITKQFTRLDKEAFPQNQPVSIFTDQDGKAAAAVYGDDQGTKLPNNTVTIAIDNTGYGEAVVWLPLSTQGQNAYYLKETEVDNIFVNRTEGMDGNGLLKVTLDKEALTKAVTAPFKNISRYAKLSVTKKDTKDASLQGAEFALYCMDGTDKLYYQTNDTWDMGQANRRIWTSDKNGLMDITVVLPAKADRQHTLYLEETLPPSGYVPVSKTDVSVTAYDSQAVSATVTNERGVVISVVKHGMPKKYVSEQTPYLTKGIGFSVYRVDGGDAVLVSKPAVTDDNGEVRFDSLPKLKGGAYYAVVEDANAKGFIASLAEAYKDGNPIAPETVKGMRMFKVATDEDEVTAHIYNTPSGTVYLMKRDVIAPLLPPTQMEFVITREGDGTFSQTRVVNTVSAGDLFPSSIPVDGGYYLTGGHYVNGGVHYTAAVLEGLAPGTYTITEQFNDAFLKKYFYPNKTKASDAWYCTKTVTVDDRGTVQVVTFGNLPFVSLPDPHTTKTAVNPATGENQVDSLLNKEQPLRYTIGISAAQKDQTVQVPLQNVTVKDARPVFLDSSQSPVTQGVAYTLKSVSIGKAGYAPTNLNETAPQTPIIATLYGIKAGGGEDKIGAYNVQGEQKTVQLAQTTPKYEGLRIVYTGENGGELDAGFYADDIVVEAGVMQTPDPQQNPVASIKNKADLSVTYSLTGESGTTLDESATVSTPVKAREVYPFAAIGKSGQIVINGVSYNVGPNEAYKHVGPGAQVKYTITVQNVSEEDAKIIDPTVLDVLPEIFEPDMAGIAGSGDGLTLQDTGRSGSKVYLQFGGSLPKDGTIQITIPGTVKTTAYSFAGDKLLNEAYLVSRHRADMTGANPLGVSFRDLQGQMPAYTVSSGDVGMAGEPDYKAIHATHEMAFQAADNVKIFKTGKGNLSDAFIGSEGFTMVSPYLDENNKDGIITYQIAVVNGGTNPVKNLRIIDVLPHIGDKTVGSGDARLSAWQAKLVSVQAPDATVYSGSSSTPDKAVLSKTEIPSEWSVGVTSGAPSILVEVNKDLAPGATYTFTVEAKAPTVDEAKDYYYFLQSNNNATMGRDLNAFFTSTSNIVKATLVPATTSVGNRVWVDLDGDGIQDGGESDNDIEPNFMLPGMKMTLRTYENGAPLTTAVTDVVGGMYGFDGLITAAPKDGAAALYDADGNTQQTALRGAMRRTYVLQESGLPKGYLVSPAFVGSATGEAKRDNGLDSNFRPVEAGAASEIFYLTANSPDMKKDLGVVPVRNLTLTKEDARLHRLLKGAVFGIYGPFDTLESLELTQANRAFEIITGEDGKAAFVSQNGRMLLRAKHYVVVEEDSGSPFADKTALTVTGNGIVPADQFKPKGDVIDGQNYFGLAMGTKDNLGDVDLTINAQNRYTAKGSLTVEAKKILLGRQLEENDFAFEITSSDHPNFAPIAASNKADGSVLFSAIQYTEADDGKIYHYGVREGSRTETGLVMDKTVGTFSVALKDENNVGVITATVNGLFPTADSGSKLVHTFTNKVMGDLTVTKQVKGNGGDKDKPFAFTVEIPSLREEQSKVFEAEGAVSSVTFVNGVAKLSLKHGERVTVKNLLADASYTVREEDYSKDGYTASATGDSGAVTANGATAAFVNERILKGALTLEKRVEGNGAEAFGREDKQYAFTIHFTPFENFAGIFDANGTYQATHTDKGGNSTARTFTVEDNQAKVLLKAGEKLSIDGLYQNIKVHVTEEDYTAEGYTAAYSNQTVTIGDTPQAVAITNTRNVGNVTISKRVEGNGADEADVFSFVAAFKNTSGVTVDRSYPAKLNGADTAIEVANGVYAFALKHGETLTIEDIAEGTSVTVKELDAYVSKVYGAQTQTAMGYTSSPATREASFTMKAGDEAKAEFVNTRNVGNVTISKRVEGNGADEADVFSFVAAFRNTSGVTVDRSYPAKLNGADTVIEVANGVYAFALKHGETLTIEDIAEGTSVTVKELDAYVSKVYGAQTQTAMGYTSSPATREASFTMKAGDEAKAEFVNTRRVGKLTIGKTVSGNRGEKNKAFPITITIENPDGSMNVRDLPYTTRAGRAGMLRFKLGAARISLKHDEAVTVQEILDGAKVNVQEDTANQGGYATAVVGEQDFVMTTAGKQIAFINVRNEYGALAVSKTVLGNAADKEKAFPFTVVLTNEDGTPFDGKLPLAQNGKRSEITFVSGEARIALAGGQSAVIGPMLTGIRYRVTEEAGNYIMQSTGAEGVIEADSQVYSAAFTNTFQTANLTIRKELEDGNLDMAAFAFEVELHYNGQPVNGDVAVRGREPITFKDGKAHITLRGGQSLTLENLQTDLGLTYQVREMTPMDYTPINQHTQGTLTKDTTVLVGNVLMGDPRGLGLNMNEGDCFN